ncbi:APC family permease [Halomarina litorea]|uniref:APC family permease n=1 Tax=Halomarina litorea TaxID=2961595 RepID=UPI0020C3A3B9|nr:APC family permease [Halomarina sp. BCD28]
MGDSTLGLSGATAIGLGGMIGGGVFSVLGVVAAIAGSAAWAAFTAASLVSLCAAYSYIKLNEVNDVQGGSVTQIQATVGNSTLAGMVGWTLLFGYVGAIAMYGYAFGSFAVRLAPLDSLFGLPMRPFFSVLAVGLFVALSVLGARATGSSEKILVALKVAILFGISAWGLYYGFTVNRLQFGTSQFASVGFVTAIAISFVSFQGWQLLMYDHDSIEDPQSTIPKAVYISIAGAIVIDSMVAILVTSLVKTSVIQQHPEIAVAKAVEPFLGQVGFVAVALAALFSTGSAINGTLFSAANFSKGMLSDGLLPDRFGDSDADGAPTRAVLVLGVLSAAFAAYGSLSGITSFGSLAFMVVFGVMSYIAFRKRDEDAIRGAIPAVGVAGTALFFPLLLWHLYTAERGTFFAVVLISVAVVGVELLYFERDDLKETVERVESKA